MARLKKNNLEEQLVIAKKNLIRAENEVKNCKNRISEIENLIKERDKENIYLLIKEYGISCDELQKLLNQSKKVVSSERDKKSKKDVA